MTCVSVADELSVLIGLYNMHTRVFTALGIDPEPHHK